MFIYLFVTKAMHLELVSDLSIDSFLAAFRRIIARRWHVRDIYSDCGTNFVEAQRQLADWARFIASRECNEHISETKHLVAFEPSIQPTFRWVMRSGHEIDQAVATQGCLLANSHL